MMKKAALALALAIPILLTATLSSSSISPAYAHTATKAGDISMEIGWGTEPPLLGQLNTITVQVNKISDGKPVANAFANAKVTVIKGGDSKDLDVLPGEASGLYAGQIIPTQLGQITIHITGTIAGQKIDNQVQIEDVVDTKTLNFPASGGSSQGIPQDFVNQIGSTISDLNTRIDNATTSAQNATDAAQKAAQDIQTIKAESDRAYLVGMVGIGVGVAGIAIAARTLSRKA